MFNLVTKLDSDMSTVVTTKDRDLSRSVMTAGSGVTSAGNLHGFRASCHVTI